MTTTSQNVWQHISGKSRLVSFFPDGTRRWIPQPGSQITQAQRCTGQGNIGFSHGCTLTHNKIEHPMRICAWRYGVVFLNRSFAHYRQQLTQNVSSWTFWSHFWPSLCRLGWCFQPPGQKILYGFAWTPFQWNLPTCYNQTRLGWVSNLHTLGGQVEQESERTHAL